MEDNSRYCSPLRYPGGKNCIFDFISKFFYENELIGLNYAEPYTGGAGLALRLLFNEYVDNIYINDFDPSIYTFWKVILEQNTRFCDWISNVTVDVENWLYQKELQSDSKSSEFEIATSTFFLNRTNVSGVIKGGIIGGINQLGKYKIDVRFNKDDLIKRIDRIEKFKHRINASNLDGIAFISKMNRLKSDVFVYLDPPYVQKGADLYMNFYNKQDHQKLATKVHEMKKRWIVSYDNNDLIRELYANDTKIVYELSQSASNRIGDEILIFSNELIFENSVSKLKSPTLI